jgi:hypothetical protein
MRVTIYREKDLDAEGPKTGESTLKRAKMHVMSELTNQIERLQGRVHETMVRL